jgi:hypothetical protein
MGANSTDSVLVLDKNGPGETVSGRNLNWYKIKHDDLEGWVFRNDYDAYTGYAIMDKPESEHVVAHEHHIPDECTIIDFNDAFYQFLKSNHRLAYKSFFTNMDVQTLFVKTDHAVEFLHFLLLKPSINFRQPTLKRSKNS